MSSLRRTTAILVTAALTLTALPPASAAPAPTALEIRAALDREVSIPGTAWMTRPDGRTVVSYDATVVGAKYKALVKATRPYGDRVVLEKLPGRLAKTVGGGAPIYGNGYQCSVGFNVQRQGQYYFLTAGHCAKNTTDWFHDMDESSPAGTVQQASFPWNDYALVKYEAGIKPGGSVNLYNGKSQDIAKAITPGIGQYVYRSGGTSGLHSGRVTGLNATVNYPEGRVAGMIRTSVCVESGDSGGPLFFRTFAFGLTSGGTGDCDRGGVSYYQPVVEALNVFGASIY
jgi:hypothetical protein